MTKDIEYLLAGVASGATVNGRALALLDGVAALIAEAGLNAQRQGALTNGLMEARTDLAAAVVGPVEAPQAPYVPPEVQSKLEDTGDSFNPPAIETEPVKDPNAPTTPYPEPATPPAPAPAA